MGNYNADLESPELGDAVDQVIKRGLRLSGWYSSAGCCYTTIICSYAVELSCFAGKLIYLVCS